MYQHNNGKYYLIVVEVHSGTTADTLCGGGV